MGHALAQSIGNATLDTLGGLITASRAIDLPEGASPRNHDVSFLTGSVASRPGLESIYTFSTVLDITALFIAGSGAILGTFTYQGSNAPTVNEEFSLQGFTAATQFLNGQTILVISVTPSNGTFVALVEGGIAGTYSNLTGTAISLVGDFVGSNLPAVAQDIAGEATPWANVNGVLGDVTFASVASTDAGSSSATPASAVNTGSGTLSTPTWTSPANILSSSSSASVILHSTFSQFNSENLLADTIAFSLPADAQIVGLELTVGGSYSFSGSGPAFQGPNACNSGTGSTWNSPSFIEVNDANYATYNVENSTATSGLLVAEGFGFSIPAGATITGISVAILKYATVTVTGEVRDTTIQLLKSGSGVGSNLAQAGSWATSSTLYNYGSSSNLWGATWTPAQINASNFGVSIAAQVSAGGAVPPHVAITFAHVGYVTITVNYNTSSGGGSSASSLNVQLSSSGVAVGTPKNVMLSTSNTLETLGSQSDQWGTDLQDIVNSSLGVLINAQAGTFTASSDYTIQANDLRLTVYYTHTSGSDALQATSFNFALSADNGILGIGAAFQAYSTTNTSVSAQLVKNGTPVGTPIITVLTTTPTVYTLGGNSTMWGTTWASSDINALGFGVQFVASGVGTTFVNDVDMLVYITPGLENFNYIKSYVQNNDQITTLALDAAGNVWQENVTSNPDVLTLALTGILPGSFAQSATADNNEYLMFSDLSIGTDRPRVVHPNAATGQLDFLPLSQVGPGAPPSFLATTSSATGQLAITSYTIASDVLTFTFTATANDTIPVVGSLYKVAGTGAAFDGQTFTVLGTPAPTDTTFAVGYIAANTGPHSVTATASPTYRVNINSITQNASGVVQFNGQILLLSAGPTSTQPGDTLTFYYGSVGSAENAGILASFAAGLACYVYITGVPSGAPGDGTWLLTGHGTAHPPSESGLVPYFTVQNSTSSYLRYGGPGGSGPAGPGNNGNFQISLATVTLASPLSTLSIGDSIQINGATPAGWNNNWIVTQDLNSGILNITSSQMLANGVAQFTFNLQSGVVPVNGQLITLSELTNLGVLNTTGVVQAVTGSTFQVSGFSGAIPAQSSSVPESGQGVTFGTQFTFDPGSGTVGEVTPSPIFGNDSGTGDLTSIGGTVIPVGAGTRQAVVFFITETGYWTAVSPAVTFTTSEDANFITASQIPIGPPNVIARGIAFTEAGANGVPGANFYVIEQNVSITVGQTVTSYTSTIINDNITTTAQFTFTDAVLLNSIEIDIQGNDLFNLIELGSSAWCVPYAGRMFYGLQLNKVTQFNNLSFDGGFQSNNGGGNPSYNVSVLGGSASNLIPLGNPNGSPGVTGTGWVAADTADCSLIDSPVTGNAFYIKNVQASTVAQCGLIYQTAYVDQFNVPILNINTAYSVRVACSNPSGNDVGTLTIDLTDYNAGIGFGKTYGTFSLPLSSMTSNVTVFSGTLLTTPFVNSVSTALQLRAYVLSMGVGSDCLIDRIEVFPTLTPYLKAQVFGSYVNDLEAIDASNSGGIIDTTSENEQACYGGFVMHDDLYLLKEQSWYVTTQNPNSEPGGWSLKEVSNKVGACGIHAYDTGEEWCTTACRQGIFGFAGGQPMQLTEEIFNLWNAINWDAGNSIVLRNDVANRMMYCAIPLPTGTSPTGVATATVQWLPDADYNPAPTSPNVMLVLNYQGLSSFAEMVAGPGLKTTMFGTLAALDMRRKYTLWQISAPYLSLIQQANNLDQILYICNGIDSSKIYELNPEQLSDDGVAINSDYCTYSFVNATKAATLPLFGLHAKRYQGVQMAIEGAGTATVKFMQNTLEAKYPYSVAGGVKLNSPVQDDIWRPLNLKANRLFVETSTNAVGAWFELSKIIMTGVADPHSPTNPTGGGNAGIVQ